MKKKVVLCIPSLGTGGAEKFTADLALQLDKLRFDVTVAVTRAQSESIFEEQLQKAGIPIVDLSGKHYPEMLKKQLRFLRRERPDVIHTSTGSVLHMMLSTALIPVATKLYTVHNQPGLLYRNNRLKKLAYRSAFTLFGYRPVGVSQQICLETQEDFHLHPGRMTAVNNGVDLHRFYPATDRKNDGRLRLITTGTMYSVKNQQQILDVFANLRKKHDNLYLTILGDGVLRPELEHQAKTLGVSSYVSMPGICKNVCEYLQDADIYVSASLTEGLPLSILEAIACGLPVVATRAGGTVDIIENGRNGYLTDVGDALELETRLEELIEDTQKRRAFSERSVEIAKRWSMEGCAAGYERLYCPEKQ